MSRHSIFVCLIDSFCPFGTWTESQHVQQGWFRNTDPWGVAHGFYTMHVEGVSRRIKSRPIQTGSRWIKCGDNKGGPGPLLLSVSGGDHFTDVVISTVSLMLQTRQTSPLLTGHGARAWWPFPETVNRSSYLGLGRWPCQCHVLTEISLVIRNSDEIL